MINPFHDTKTVASLNCSACGQMIIERGYIEFIGATENIGSMWEDVIKRKVIMHRTSCKPVTLQVTIGQIVIDISNGQVFRVTDQNIESITGNPNIKPYL